MSLPSEKNLSALLDERRTFPPQRNSSSRANWNDPAIYDRAANTRKVSGRKRRSIWTGSRRGSACWSGTRRGPSGSWAETQRHLQLRGPARAFGAAQQGRHYLGGRAGRFARADVRDARARGESLCQRAEIARRREGRPHRDLHGHGSRAGHCHAGLREDRRGAFGGVRRIFGGGAARAHQRRQGESGHHRRRRVAARHRGAAQGQRGRCADRNADHRKSGGL
jgi:hypothetical protein